MTSPMIGRRHLAGERMSGMAVAHTGLGLARGEMGGKHWRKPKLDQTPRFVGEDRPTNSSNEIGT